jgi:RND family efflux transporter MFP subunit
VIHARSAVIAAACVFAPVGLVVARELSPDPPSPPIARNVAPRASVVAPDTRAEPSRDQPERLIGLVLPRESADVGAAVPGRLIAVHVRMGDRVREGQPIATLDARLADADITAAEAAVRSQEVEQSLARGAEAAAREHEARVRALAEHGLAAGEELVSAVRQSEECRLRAQASASLLAQKVAQLQRLSLERRLMEVRAPFAGVIAARYLDPGTAIAVAASQPIARVISEALVLRVALPEAQAGRLRVGTRLVATNPANGLSAQARVERVAAEIDPIARIWLLEAGMEGAPSTGELTEGAITSGLELEVAVPRAEVP